MAGDGNGSGVIHALCPLCGEPLYGWIVVAPPGGHERVLVRCENCGAVLERGAEVDLAEEWEAVRGAGDAVRIPNRGSLQATIGLDGWAAIDLAPGRLLLTRRSLELLAERNQSRLAAVGTPQRRRSQAWMWQTLLNGLTFHPNFARELRAGRLRPSTAISRPRFFVDLVVTVLGAPLVALVSVPLEAAAAAIGRGGELEATVLRPPAPDALGER
jgi:hypothetical protein